MILNLLLGVEALFLCGVLGVRDRDIAIFVCFSRRGDDKGLELESLDESSSFLADFLLRNASSEKGLKPRLRYQPGILRIDMCKMMLTSSFHGRLRRCFPLIEDTSCRTNLHNGAIRFMSTLSCYNILTVKRDFPMFLAF